MWAARRSLQRFEEAYNSGFSLFPRNQPVVEARFSGFKQIRSGVVEYDLVTRKWYVVEITMHDIKGVPNSTITTSTFKQ